MPANDINGQVGNSTASSGPLDFRTQGTNTTPGKATQPTGQGQQQYDAEGYPLPNADQVQAYKQGYYYKGKAGDGAYDPSLAPPDQDINNPYPPGSAQYKRWRSHNDALKRNQEFKEAWQKQHESQRQVKPAAPVQSSAPATPFQSSGVDLTKQGKGESYIDSILQHYGESGVPQVGNQSQQTLDRFRSSQPADMSPYYDQASKLTSAKIDNAMAARGSYGSSNATGQIGAAEVALRAQQAKDNAGYGLSRFAQEGSLAGAADQQGNTSNGIQYQWTKGLADLASKDQSMGQERNQDLWNNNFQLAAAKAGIYGAGATGAINDVSAATDAAINARQGQATDSLSNANANANASNSATAGLLNAAAQGTSNYLKYKASN